MLCASTWFLKSQLTETFPQILPLSDPTAAWTSQLGLSVDLSKANELGLGLRTSRFALILDDLKITYLGVSRRPRFGSSSL